MKNKYGILMVVISIITFVIFLLVKWYWGFIISGIMLFVAIDFIYIPSQYKKGSLKNIVSNNKKFVFIDTEGRRVLTVGSKLKRTKYGKISVLKITNESPYWKMYSAYERKRLSQNLRADVMHRDKYTCQHCGRKAPDVELHIDHIYPIAKGGRTELNNLQVLCKDCNLGKKAKYTD